MDPGPRAWRVKDSNLRRQSRRIYSPLPLAARATRQGAAERIHSTDGGLSPAVSRTCTLDGCSEGRLLLATVVQRPRSARDANEADAGSRGGLRIPTRVTDHHSTGRSHIEVLASREQPVGLRLGKDICVTANHDIDLKTHADTVKRQDIRDYIRGDQGHHPDRDAAQHRQRCPDRRHHRRERDGRPLMPRDRL